MATLSSHSEQTQLSLAQFERFLFDTRLINTVSMRVPYACFCYPLSAQVVMYSACIMMWLKAGIRPAHGPVARGEVVVLMASIKCRNNTYNTLHAVMEARDSCWFTRRKLHLSASLNGKCLFFFFSI